MPEYQNERIAERCALKFGKWSVLTKKMQVSIFAHTKSHGVQEARIFLLHPDKKFAFLHPLESYEPF